MLFESCKTLRNISLYAFPPNLIKEIPDHLKTQEMCNKAMHIIPDLFFLISDTFKTE